MVLANNSLVDMSASTIINTCNASVWTINDIPVNLIERIHWQLFKKYVIKRYSGISVFQESPSPKRLTLNYQMLDCFLIWWFELKHRISYFSVFNFYVNEEAYKTDMINYLTNNPNRWLVFFKARTCILESESPETHNFFYADQCIDRDILIKTFQPSYAKSLKSLQKYAIRNTVFLYIDVAMILMWKFGHKFMIEREEAESSFNSDPDDAPVYNGEKLYVQYRDYSSLWSNLENI